MRKLPPASLARMNAHRRGGRVVLEAVGARLTTVSGAVGADERRNETSLAVWLYEPMKISSPLRLRSTST